VATPTSSEFVIMLDSVPRGTAPVIGARVEPRPPPPGGGARPPFQPDADDARANPSYRSLR
jgi:hypothetical protein